MADDEFICKYARPGIGCGAYEILCLGILFFFAGIACLCLLCWHGRSRKKSPPLGLDFNIPFWATMAIWTFYHSIMTIFKFPWDPKTFYICAICIDSILLLLPFSFLVMIISEMLFMYRNPGTQRVNFSRIVFVLFLVIFLILGILLSMIDVEELLSANDTMMLWHSAVSLTIALFVLMPAWRLIQAVSHPVVQPEDVSCVRQSKGGLFAIFLLFLARSVHNFLIYIGHCPWNDWYQRELANAEDPKKLGTAVRCYLFFFEFVFNLGCPLLGMGGVYMLRKHDIDFADDSFYAPDRSDTTATQKHV